MVDTYVDAAGTKDDFFDLIVDERAWEFGGENIRWKDLVRWNLYNQVVYTTFWRYYGVGSDDYSYDLYDEYDTYPRNIYYHVVSNPGDGSFPNTVLDVIEFFTDPEYGVDCQWAPIPVDYQVNHGDRLPPITGSDAWNQAEWFRWIDEATGIARADCRCSLRGYIYIDQQGSLSERHALVFAGD